MTDPLKYTTNSPEYNPMGKVSNGTRPKKYSAYNTKYQVKNFTHTPKISPPKFTFNTYSKPVEMVTMEVRPVKQSILQRLVTQILMTKKTVKNAIRNFFSLKKRK